jgi:hypothetical protein
MTRAYFRYTAHTISEHPDTEVTFEAECLWCEWRATPSDTDRSVDLDCLRHAGRSGHKGFRRVRTSFAAVVRR